MHDVYHISKAISHSITSGTLNSFYKAFHLTCDKFTLVGSWKGPSLTLTAKYWKITLFTFCCLTFIIIFWCLSVTADKSQCLLVSIRFFSAENSVLKVLFSVKHAVYIFELQFWCTFIYIFEEKHCGDICNFTIVTAFLLIFM